MATRHDCLPNGAIKRTYAKHSLIQQNSYICEVNSRLSLISFVISFLYFISRSAFVTIVFPNNIRDYFRAYWILHLAGRTMLGTYLLLFYVPIVKSPALKVLWRIILKFQLFLTLRNVKRETRRKFLFSLLLARIPTYGQHNILWYLPT